MNNYFNELEKVMPEIEALKQKSASLYDEKYSKINPIQKEYDKQIKVVEDEISLKEQQILKEKNEWLSKTTNGILPTRVVKIKNVGYYEYWAVGFIDEIVITENEEIKLKIKVAFNGYKESGPYILYDKEVTTDLYYNDERLRYDIDSSMLAHPDVQICKFCSKLNTDTKISHRSRFYANICSSCLNIKNKTDKYYRQYISFEYKHKQHEQEVKKIEMSENTKFGTYDITPYPHTYNNYPLQELKWFEYKKMKKIKIIEHPGKVEYEQQLEKEEHERKYKEHLEKIKKDNEIFFSKYKAPKEEVDKLIQEIRMHAGNEYKKNEN
jgi:hypothetical protein